MSLEPATIAPVTPAPGWDAEDIAMLREMAQLGMQMARDLVAEAAAHRSAVEAGEAEPLAVAQAAQAELRVSRITRTVRLSLTLKATACGAGTMCTAGPSGGATCSSAYAIGISSCSSSQMTCSAS